MGDLSDGPDLELRLKWAADVDKLLRNVHRAPRNTDGQIRFITAAQTILEFGEKALKHTRAISQQLQSMKDKQLLASYLLFNMHVLTNTVACAGLWRANLQRRVQNARDGQPSK